MLLFNILTIVITLFFIEFLKSMKPIIMTIHPWHLHVKNIVKSLQDEMVKMVLVLDGTKVLNLFDFEFFFNESIIKYTQKVV